MSSRSLGIVRSEQRLELLLADLAAVRRRLNSLTWQRAVFVAVATVVGALALVIVSAVFLGPLVFLGTAVALSAIVLGAGVLCLRLLLRRHLTRAGAARVADERAVLKGRLQTLVEIAGRDTRPVLFPYLVEDAHSLRASLSPRTIEPRRFSRSALALIPAGVLLALALALRSATAPLLGPGAGKPGATREGLMVRPAQPQFLPYSLPRRGGRLSDPSAASDGSGSSGSAGTARPSKQTSGLISRLMAKAQNAGRRLQDLLTGRTHASASVPDQLARNAPAGPNEGDQDKPDKPNAPGAATASGLPPPKSQPATSARQPDDKFAANETNQKNGTRASHGSGTDPHGLFGARENASPADRSFQIAINARSGEQATTQGGPPHARHIDIPLAPDQRGDEPVTRETVPAGDRSIIKRIFER